MTTDQKLIRHHFDLDHEDLLIVTPTVRPEMEERLAAGLKGAVIRMTRSGRTARSGAAVHCGRDGSDHTTSLESSWGPRTPVFPEVLSDPTIYGKLSKYLEAHPHRGRWPMSQAMSPLSFDERWFSTALKSIGDAVIATDDVGRVLFMNPIAETLTGWSDDEVHGWNLGEIFVIVNELTRNPVENPVARVLDGGHIIGLANHTILVARDGKEIPIDDSAAPILDAEGRVVGVILVFRDVTEKRRTELLNERLASIVGSSDDLVASKTLDGVITSWNQGAERILGYTADEVIGHHVSMLMPPEFVEDTERILSRVRRGEKVDHYQTKRRRKDGTIIDVSLTVSPIRDIEGRIVGASKIGRDITQEKLIEAERVDAERRKDEFLAMLAHELRNPLSAIHGAAQLFGKLETEAELEWAKETVLRQVKHLARLIDDLLDVSRISRGRIDLRKETINLSPVLNSAVEAVGPLLEERKHELSISLINGGLRLEADPVRLEQILVNLLTNAAKYTDAGGHVSISARHEGGDIVIKVRDTGVGITPELLPRVFDLFVQGDRTIARSEGGLGIGLTLVKKLVEMHEGEVSVESKGVGEGSEFTVRLPALEQPPIARKWSPQESLPRVAQQSSRVLVIDDSIDNATALGKLLKLLGHDVSVAYDGMAAVEAARAHRPEFVLLDIGLPGMDGYEVIKRLRADECCKDSLIIAVSGYGQPEDLRRSKAAGFDHHLVKPVDYKILLALFATQ
jgi:PAS domain S-box-containing protein